MIDSRIIFLTGVDGSGKTFLAKRLIELLSGRGIQTRYVWSRFNNYLSKPLLAYTRLVGLNYYENHEGVKVGYHNFKGHTAVSAAFVALQLADVWISAIVKFWIPLFLRRNVIVSDRGPYDTLIDVALDTGYDDLPCSFWGHLYARAIPFSHAVFLVDRDSEKIEHDRPDTRLDRTHERRRSLYARHRDVLGFRVINNNGAIEDSLSQIIEILFNEEKAASAVDIK